MNKKQIYFAIPIISILIMGMVWFGMAYAANTYSVDLESASSQYLSITDANQTGLDLSTALTFEAWVKIENQVPTDKQYVIISKNKSSGNQLGYNLDYRDMSGTKKFRLFLDKNGDATAYDILDFNYTLPAATWTHVAITWLADTKTAELFINGTSQGTTTGTNVTSIFNGTAPFYIGVNDLSADSYFDGLIDDVRIWNDVRTSTEIANNYQAELAGSEANLVGYWKLNNSLSDETANNNDLTNNNSAVFSTDVPGSPVLSNIQSSGISTNSALITWDTDLSSNSKVSYGTSSGSYTSSTTDGTTTTSHSVSLSSLSNTTTYYYVVTSTTATGGAATSTERSFATLTPNTFTVRKGSDQSVSSTNFTDDGALVLTLAGSKTYIIDGVIFAESASGVPDIKMAFATSSAGVIMDIGYISSGVSGMLEYANIASSGVDMTANTPIAIKISGTLKTSSSSSVLQFRWAQNSSNANAVIVKEGSYLRAEEI